MITSLSFGCLGLVQQSCNKSLQFRRNTWQAESSNPKWLARHLMSGERAFYPVKSELLAFLPSAGGHSIRRIRYSYSNNKSQNKNTKIMATGADRRYFPVDDDDLDTESFWLWLVKEIIRDLKSALLFLWEQPGQLKYIEWPSFQSTLKTATLTLMLVMLLIIFLSSVDSALSYLLVLTLRRKS